MVSNNGKKNRNERFQKIIELLEKAYPDANCELEYKTAFELLIATILSAQCTDKRVNLVTRDLFKKYKTPKDFVDVEAQALENEIRSTGFFRNKTKNIKAACQALINENHGRVPNTMDELIKLPGVARKTANVILGTAFSVASGVVVDTHVYRIARRLGFSNQKDPNKVEKDLMKIVPRDHWISFSHCAVHHGRYTCLARKPKCYACAVYDLCASKEKIPVTKLVS